MPEKTSSPRKRQKVGIIGGGLGGLTTACLLGQAGFDVVCVDAEPLARQISPAFDGRTTAISYGSRTVLEKAGVWGALEGARAAIKTIDIIDGDSPSVMTFRATDIDAEAFGWIVDNADLRRALIKKVQDNPRIEHLTGITVQDVELAPAGARVLLADNRTLDVDLVIGADGRKSLVRERMGIGAWGHAYGQTAIVCIVAHEKPHAGLALEHFRREGPFALLPYTQLPNGTNRSALVWSVHGPDATHWVNAPEDVFNAAIQARAGGRFGRMWLAGRREAWPLTLVKSYTYTAKNAPRAVLVAEAAHGMHPIAGQGLNMSLRDIDALATLLAASHRQGRDIGDSDILKTYQRQRRIDNLAMCFATDGLTRLFSNDFLPAILLRRAGLSLVKRVPAAMRFFMHQAMGVANTKRTGSTQ